MIKRWIEEWPWTNTLVLVTLLLATSYVVGLPLLAALDRTMPPDTMLEKGETIIQTMLVTSSATVIGKRATFKREAVEVEAAIQEQEALSRTEAAP